MSSLLGKVHGSRGECTRQGTRDSGMTASIQSWTQRVSIEWEWDRLSQTWHVEVHRAKVVPGTKDQHEVLWKGAISE